MDRLAEVPAFLLIPPVGVGVAVLALDRGRVDVAAVLRCSRQSRSSNGPRSQETAQSTTNHVGVLGWRQTSRSLWVLLVQNLLIGILRGHEASSLGNRESSDSGAAAEGRRPGESLSEHLDTC